MPETPTFTDAFESNIKTAILAGSVNKDLTSHTKVDPKKAEKALRKAISVEYHAHIDERRELYKKALSVGDEDTISVAEDNLEEMKDKFGAVFAAGHSRFNKAMEAFNSGDISIDFVEFSTEAHDDGAVSATEHGVTANTQIPVAKSASGNTYPLVETDDGHSMCLCHDKELNDDFPVCKHEMVWLLTQVVLFERGCVGLIDNSVSTLLKVLETDISVETETEEVVFEVIGDEQETPLMCPK